MNYIINIVFIAMGQSAFNPYTTRIRSTTNKKPGTQDLQENHHHVFIQSPNSGFRHRPIRLCGAACRQLGGVRGEQPDAHAVIEQFLVEF